MNLHFDQGIPVKWRRKHLYSLIFLGIAALAAQLVQLGMERGAKTRLGGDMEVRSVHPFPMQAIAYMGFNSRAMTRGPEFMAEARHNDKTLPILLTGIDQHYPLYGELKLQDIQNKRVFARTPHRKRWGAAVDQKVLDELGIAPKEIFRVGDADLIVNAVIRSAPDRKDDARPQVIVNRATAALPGIMQTAAEVSHRYRLKLHKGITPREWQEKFSTTIPQANWQITSWQELTPSYYMKLRWLAWILSLLWLAALTGFAISCYNDYRARHAH